MADPLALIKAHAYGNDFLYASAEPWRHRPRPGGAGRAACARHTGIGADGLILYRPTARGATDAPAQRRRQPVGGLRQRPALPGRDPRRGRGAAGRRQLHVDTDAGTKTLTLARRDAAGPPRVPRRHGPGRRICAPLDLDGRRRDLRRASRCASATRNASSSPTALDERACTASARPCRRIRSFPKR